MSKIFYNPNWALGFLRARSWCSGNLASVDLVFALCLSNLR